MHLKTVYCVGGAIALVIIGEQKFKVNGTAQNLSNSKYIACLLFGYTLFQVWGTHKPTAQMANVWDFVQPILFGTLGAALILSQIRPEDVGKSVLCVIIG